jgi:hypothetical protein
VPGAELTVTRGTMPATARVKIEAVLLDPGDATTFVGIGEDGSAVGTAKSWRTSIGAFLTFGRAVDLQLSLVTQQPPATLAALGEVLFGSNPDAPTGVDLGSMSFSAVPANFTTRLRIGPSSQAGTVTSTLSSVVTVHVADISSGEEKDFDVTVDKLPTRVDVLHQVVNGHDVATYDADATVAKLTGAYHDYAGGGIVTAAQVDVTTLPARLTVDNAGEVTAVSVPSGVIGALEVRYATGQDVPASPAGTDPYVSIHRYDTSHLTAGLRLDNIASASFDGTGPYVGDIVFGTAPSFIPISVVDDVTGVTATGHLSNLPAHVTVTVDLANGQLVYDGHGEGIKEIAISATDSRQPFFAKATRLDVTVDGLPAAITVDFKQDTGSVTITPSAPIGAVSLLASDGAPAPVVTGDYASYEQTPTLWRAFVQMVGITKLSFTPSPLSGTIETSSPQLMTLFGELATTGNDVTLHGSIDKLPSHIDFALTPQTDGSQVLDYNSHGEVVDTITIDGSGFNGPYGADTLHAEVDHLPSHLTATLPAPYGTAVFDPHGDTVGRVLVQAYPHTRGPKKSQGTDQTVYADTDTGQLTIDIHHIGYNSFYTGPSATAVELTYDIGSDPLDVHIGGNGAYFNATVSNPEPASIIGFAGGDTRLDYTVNDKSPNYSGDGSINELTVETNGAGYLDVALQHIAPHIHFCIGGSFSCIPNWVPPSVVNDTVFGVPPSFGLQVQPTDLSGNDWPTRILVNGTFCLSQSDPSCEDPTQKKERITISNLQFGTVEAGFGNTTDDCGDSSALCGRAFGYFNTDDTHITGDVKYYQNGDNGDSPFVEYRADDPANYITATNFFLYDSYDVPSNDPHPSGRFHCGGKPNLNVTFADTTFDFLSGDLGVCPGT